MLKGGATQHSEAVLSLFFHAIGFPPRIRDKEITDKYQKGKEFFRIIGIATLSEKQYLNFQSLERASQEDKIPLSEDQIGSEG